MSDFLERLRGSSAEVDVPSVDAVRSRARRIQRRRYVAVSSGAVLVVVIAGIGLFVRGPRSRPASGPATFTQAQDSSPAATAAPESALTAGGAEKTAQGTPPAPRAAGGMSGSAAVSAQSRPYGAQSDAATTQRLQLTLTAKNRSSGRGEDLTLKACNPNGSSMSVQFGSSQRYDFDVEQDGRIVWTWSHDKTFTQVTGAETWKAHECKSWTVTWDGMDNSKVPAPPGTYSAYGWMAGHPKERSGVSFCLDVC